MRKIVQLCIALLIFAFLAAQFVSGPDNLRTADSAQQGPVTNADSSSIPATQERGMQLRLDTRLAAPPQQIVPPWYAPATKRLVALRQSEYQRPVLFLSGALVLGLLTGWSLRPRATARGRSGLALTRPDDAAASGDRESSKEPVNDLLAQQEGEASRLQEENLALRDTIESHEISHHSNQERLTDHQAIIAELRTELSDTEEVNNALQAAIQQQALLAEEIEERDMVINNLQADVAQLRENSESREQKITELDEQILGLTDGAERARQDCIALEELLSELQTTKETLVARVESLEPQAALVPNLNEQLQDLDDRYQQSQFELQALTAALESAESQAERALQLQQQLTQAQEQFDDIDAAHDAAQTSLRELQHSYADVLERKASLDEEHRQLVADHTEQSEAQKEFLQELEDSKVAATQQAQELKAVKESLDTEKADNETLNSNLQELRNFVDQANDDLQRTEHDLEAAHVELANEKDSKKMLLEQQQNLQNQLDQLNTILEGAEENNEELNASMALLREDLAVMANKLNDKNDTVHDLQTELANTEALLADKQTEALKLADTLDAGQQKLAAMDEEIAAARDAELRLDSWDNSLQTYKREVVSKNRLIDDLRDQLGIATHSSEMLKKQIREMDDHIETLISVQTEVADIDQETSRIHLDLKEQNATIEELSDLHQQHGKQLEVFLEAIEALQSDRDGWEKQLHESIQTLAVTQEELTDNCSLMLRLEEVATKELLHTDYVTDQAFLVDGSIVDKLTSIVSHASGLRESRDAVNAENHTLLLALDEQAAMEQQQRHAIDDFQEHISELTRQRDAQESELRHQTQAHEKLQQSFDSQDLEIGNLQRRIQENAAQLETLESTHHADQERIEAGQQNLLRAQKQLEFTQEELVQSTAEIEKLRKQIAMLRTHHGEIAQRLKIKAQSLKETFSNENQLLENRYRETNAQLKGELADLNEANEQLLAEIAAQREKLSSLHPVAEPVPVLRAKITTGNQPDNIPVLGRAKRRDSVE